MRKLGRQVGKNRQEIYAFLAEFEGIRSVFKCFFTMALRKLLDVSRGILAVRVVGPTVAHCSGNG